MHGMILAEMQRFVDAKFGPQLWRGLLGDSGLGLQSYEVNQSYSDQHVARIVAAAARQTGLSRDAILESFGEFIAPHLLAMYPSLVKAEWKTLDVVEHTEDVIHAVVRSQHPDADPPYLRVHRTGDAEIVIFYDSPRKLCFIAKGIVKGLADHFGETVGVVERRCMLTGAPDCTLVLSADG